LQEGRHHARRPRGRDHRRLQQHGLGGEEEGRHAQDGPGQPGLRPPSLVKSREVAMPVEAETMMSVVTDKDSLSPRNSPNRPFPLEWTRNIGIAAHIDAGKTTTTERILFYSGAVHKMGEVHDGTTVTDWMDQERERGITITAAAISCAWNASCGPWEGIKQRINIIDTPGHVDFTAEVERSLRVLDGAIAVFDAVAGVQPQSETVWRQANKYNVPRLAFINKMDRVGADFHKAVDEIRTKLKGNAHALYLPIGAEDNFRGMVDLVHMNAYLFDDTKDPLGLTPVTAPIPDDMVEEAKVYRDKLIEAVSDFGDHLAQVLRRRPGLGLQEEGHPAPARLRGELPAEPDRRAPDDRQGLRRGPGRGRRRRQGEGRGPGLQALDRPVRRQARVLPGLHRHAEEGLDALQPAHPPARARVAPGPHARDRPRGDRRRLLGRHLRARR